MKIFRFHKSFNAVLIGLAESGNFIPPEIASAMTQQATGYRSADRHLMELCECSQLRDTGLIATNVSPLVVDLTQPLPESPSDSDLSSLYHQTTRDGQSVYKDTKQPLQQSDHQLRRNTFFLPFFQKMDTELDRLIEKFGSATLLMLSHNPNLTGRKIYISGDTTENSELAEIGVENEESTDQPFIGQLPESELVRTCKLTLSSDCFLVDDAWSMAQANQTREVLAKVVRAFAKE